MKLADAMPEDKFGRKSTPAQRVATVSTSCMRRSSTSIC